MFSVLWKKEERVLPIRYGQIIRIEEQDRFKNKLFKCVHTHQIIMIFSNRAAGHVQEYK